MAPTSRRGFLVAAGGAAAGGAALAGPATQAAVARPGPALMLAGAPTLRATGALPLLRTHVAGAGRHGRLPDPGRLVPGTALHLSREPGNRYDRPAVSVWTAEGVKLG